MFSGKHIIVPEVLRWFSFSLNRSRGGGANWLGQQSKRMQDTSGPEGEQKPQALDSPRLVEGGMMRYNPHTLFASN